MELKDNPVQAAVWQFPVAQVLSWEHLKAREDHGLRGLVAKALERFETRGEGLELDRDSYAQNLGWNDRIGRLRAYVNGDQSGVMGYATHEQIANDLAALIAFSA